MVLQGNTGRDFAEVAGRDQAGDVMQVPLRPGEPHDRVTQLIRRRVEVRRARDVGGANECRRREVQTNLRVPTERIPARQPETMRADECTVGKVHEARQADEELPPRGP